MSTKDYEINEAIKTAAVEMLVEDGFEPALAAKAAEFTDSKLAMIVEWKEEIETKFPTSEGRFLALGLLLGSFKMFVEDKGDHATFCLKMARLAAMVRKGSLS